MKKFKKFLEQRHATKEVSPLQGLVATMPDFVMTDDEVDVKTIDKIITKPVSEEVYISDKMVYDDSNEADLKESNSMTPEVKKLVRIGQKMMDQAPNEKDDKISNAYAKLGDALTHYGTTFSAKSMADLEKKTGMKKDLIAMLIKRVQKQ